MAKTPSYDVNYEDERFAKVEADKNAALSSVDSSYNNMINQSDKYFDKQIGAVQDYADKQSALQTEQTEFAIDQIEQQRAQAEKDYQKEQSGAYVDWQKQSNKYGVNAEKTAAAGLTGTGYSETMQVSMYNTYQQRVASARESFQLAVLNYNNAIKDARLQNNAALAQIAYDALQKQLELSLQGFQYKNQLILDKADKKLELDNVYYSRYKDVLNQINTENALAEESRQFNLNYEAKTKEFEEGVRQFNEELARLKALDAEENKLAIEELELKKQQLLEEQRQFNESAKLELAKIEADKSKKIQLTDDEDVTKSALKPNDTVVEDTTAPIDNTSSEGRINTLYYSGKLNPDAMTFGTLGNGYQPKGIGGHGALSKTADTIDLVLRTLDGREKEDTQPIWKAADGTLWYWNEVKNAYIRFSLHGGKGGKF